MRVFLLPRPLLLVVYGARGDLFQRFLVAALWIFWRKLSPSSQKKFKVLLTGSYPLQDDRGETVELNAWLDIVADKFRINRRLSGWDKFKAAFHYEVGRCSEEAGLAGTAKFIHDWKSKHSKGEIKYYFSLPYDANLGTLRAMRKHDLGQYSKDSSCLFEKPMHIKEEQIDLMEDELRTLCDSKGIVEHFRGKPGPRQFPHMVYADRRFNSILQGSQVEAVYWTIMEEVGSEGRYYPGPLVDSFLNHYTFYLGLTLGNPLVSGLEYSGTELTRHVDSLSFNANRASEEEARGLFDAFYQERDFRGIYLMCYEDQGRKGSHTPMGAYLRCVPNINRFPGTTPWHILHCKNAGCKTAKVTYVLKPTSPGRPSDKFVFHMDSFDPDLGSRFYGWKYLSSRLSEKVDEPVQVVESNLVPIPSDISGGYPQIIEWFLIGEMSHFMTIEFQKAAIRFVMPIANYLDKTAWEEAAGERIWFHKGQDPSRLIIRDRLHQIRPNFGWAS